MGIDELRDALRGLNAALEGQTAEGSQTLSAKTLAAEAVKALGEEGLRELIRLHAADVRLQDIDRTFTIVPTPEDSTVIINGVERSSVSAWAGETVEWSVTKEGYVTQSGETVVNDDTELPVALESRPLNGVYVAYTDNDGTNRICATSDWDNSLGEAQGVLVGDGEHQVLVAPTECDTTKNWSSGNSNVSGCTLTTSTDEAEADYEGQANTAGIVAKGGDYATDAYAGGWCNLYSYGNKAAGEWWLPSCGELYGLLSEHFNDINSALAAIGGTALSSSTYWSSTQYASNSAWSVAVSGGAVGHYGKTANAYNVRPVSSFIFEG